MSWNRFFNKLAKFSKGEVPQTTRVTVPHPAVERHSQKCVRVDRPSAEEMNQRRIAERAYQLWEAAGRPEGDGRDFWLAAESEVDGEIVFID